MLKNEKEGSVRGHICQLFRRVEGKRCCKSTQKYGTLVESNMKAKMQCQ